MEKEQELERERDRARSTKFFEPKFTLSEPPPKVCTSQTQSLMSQKFSFNTFEFFFCPRWSLREWNQAGLGTRSVLVYTFRYCRAVSKDMLQDDSLYFLLFHLMLLCVQLNEALCASSPDLASPSDYQSPIDSTNTLALPVRSPRRRSMGVRKSPVCACVSSDTKATSE